MRIEQSLLNKVKREAQNRQMTVTDLLVDMIKSYDYEAQNRPLVRKDKPWWE